MSRSRSVGAFRLATVLRRLTVAGQRRICTGFPPNGCDDDRATLPARPGTDRGAVPAGTVPSAPRPAPAAGSASIHGHISGHDGQDQGRGALDLRRRYG